MGVAVFRLLGPDKVFHIFIDFRHEVHCFCIEMVCLSLLEFWSWNHPSHANHAFHIP